MDGVVSQLVALENMASNFSHFIIEHWIPAQAVFVELHDATVRGTAWYSLATRGLVMGGGVGGGVGRMVCCSSHSNC